MNDKAKRSMAPVGSDDAVLLILGSLPGERSLAAQAYYAHPQNQFWRLLGGAIGEPLLDLSYAERLERLADRGIALWDVVGEALRKGSLDGDLRSVRPNELTRFVDRHPRLGAVAFNGQTAARIGRRTLGERPNLRLIDLPSSSPAYTLRPEEKGRHWAELGGLALPPKSRTLG